MFRPMLATDFEESRLRFPYCASPKLDGIRCLVIDGEGKTRSMKTFPNLYLRDWLQRNSTVLANLDGEIIVGPATAADCFAKTTSGVMKITGEPEFGFYVFDVIDPTGRRPFRDRAREAEDRLKRIKIPNVIWLEPTLVNEGTELRRYEEKALDLGYEGVMLRHPDGRYKQGRATVGENTLLKVKRFSDAEAVIVGVEERQHNGNAGFTNEIGRTARSSAKGGKIGMGTLGAVVVEGLPGQPFAGVRFNIGTGFNDLERASLWSKDLIGSVVRYRFFDIGVKDAPRFPVFSGFRHSGT